MTAVPSMLSLNRVPKREQLLYAATAPAAHGYGRGDLLGIFAEVDGEQDAVGYGHVTRVQDREVELLALFLPHEYRMGALWIAPLPDDEHLGHRIGKVLHSPDTGRFELDVGQADGVRLGDTYRVYDGAIPDAGFDARTLHKRPVGLLQVVKADDGKLVSVAVLRQGQAPRGAWIELVDADMPEQRMLDDRRRISVLILNLVDERVGEAKEDPQRDYWQKLRNVLLSKQVAAGEQGVLRLALAERKLGLIGGGDPAIVEVGQEYGADVVLWGSVQCSSSEACVRPMVTFVNREKFGNQEREWQERTGSPDLVGVTGKNVGGVDQTIEGLASWLAGLAYYEAQAYGDAAFHLEHVPLETDLHREWQTAQGYLFRCYEVLGDWTKAEQTARRRIDHGVTAEQDWIEAHGRIDLARSLFYRGRYEEAWAEAERARVLAEGDDDPHTIALAWSLLGDILRDRGELDEALRIHKQKRLPIFEELGDTHSAALTWGQIADILYQRGKLGEALHIHEQKRLPIFEELGDIYSAANAWGSIGDILHNQGKLDEALRIHKRRLPVYEKLGDVRSAALTWGRIGAILYDRGDFDEAIRIYKHKELPVYEELGAIRDTAITWGRIGAILYDRGNLDEALHIHKHKELPAFEKLGDIHSTAITWRNIGHILADRGDLDEALRVYKHKTLPVCKKLGDVQCVANTWGSIGHALRRKGRLDEALHIHKHKELPIYEKTGDVLGVAATWGTIGEILASKGHFNKAIRIYKKKQLPTYEEIRDVRRLARTWAMIGDALAWKGRLNKAIRIYDTKVQPVAEATADRRTRMVLYSLHAIHLLARNTRRDRQRAGEFLRTALDDARAMQVPLADELRDQLVEEGFRVQPLR